MKHCLFIFFSFFILNTLFAVTYRTTIHSIDVGKNHEPYLIMFSDGHVAFVEKPADTLVDSLRLNIQRDDEIEVVLDNSLNIISLRLLGPNPESSLSRETFPGEIMTYDPSVVSAETAQRTFLGMRRDYQNASQCYNRAHIWTYEAYKKSALRTNKLFLFFTSRYIRRYRFYWWFHVTPMIYVGGQEQSSWRTLDRRYTSAPLQLQTWTNVFMYNDAYCPVVYKYSSYRYHQESQDCYLIPTSMYFWQPRDIETQERTGYVKRQFFSSEIDYAYWEAF